MKNKNYNKQWLIAAAFTVASVVLGMLPFLSKSIPALYFNMDPDPMYVGNALQFLETGKVFFMDHPGTPLISLITLSYLPIKIYASLFLHISNFAVYFLQHLDFIYFYTRVLLLIVFSSGIFMFHLTLYKRYKDVFVNLFFGSILFLDAMHLGMYWGITPEILAFTLTALWLLLLNKYEESSNAKYLFVASALTGIIFAVKMSFLFILPAHFIYIYLRFGNVINKLIHKGFTVAFRSAIYASLGFLISMIPLWYKKREVFNYVLSYFFHTGKMGGGSVGFIDWAVFMNSLLGMFTNPLTLIIFLVSMFLVIHLFKKELLAKSFLISGLIGLFAFMKYSDYHYQTANFLLLALAFSAVFAKLPALYKIVLLAIVLLFFNNSVQQNFIHRKQLVAESNNLQQFINSNSPSAKVVWEFANSKDFSTLRSDEWSGFTLLNDYNQAFPNTLSLDWRDLSKIANFPLKPSSPLNSICWDMLILQNQTWDNFIKAQKDPPMYIKESIPGTQMLSVTYKNKLNCRAQKNK